MLGNDVFHHEKKELLTVENDLCKKHEKNGLFNWCKQPQTKPLYLSQSFSITVSASFILLI